jgi:hypothetical protein
MTRATGRQGVSGRGSQSDPFGSTGVDHRANEVSEKFGALHVR